MVSTAYVPLDRRVDLLDRARKPKTAGVWFHACLHRTHCRQAPSHLRIAAIRPVPQSIRAVSSAFCVAGTGAREIKECPSARSEHASESRVVTSSQGAFSFAATYGQDRPQRWFDPQGQEPYFE